ncbi:ADP-ribosyltransferase [Nocardia donostiensis]|uniref:ADP ribosyltransferase domain-containing protein n=1 Tax=Nocardia donostiensis TaxID=1538463 RepID=A0A1V2TDF0_9NOCA|nr:ADP-ribosyltransferase [Nocardia donostiensis]ONM47524.1 hypothetical protein B0T46_16555 [Nocardia donostiensis]OQS15133.1 hypothetical protein B0T36_10750 [Nocardia donostiensis]OQS24306.1 hypothetical protein B0T44_01485 [Nocardia donostiensis]
MYHYVAVRFREVAEGLSENILILGEQDSNKVRELTATPLREVLHRIHGGVQDGADQVAAACGIRSQAPPSLVVTSNRDEARVYGDTVWGPTVQRLNAEQRETARNYTLGSEPINAALRGEFAYYDFSRPDIPMLDEMLLMTPTPEWIQVWKTIRAERLFPDIDIAEVRPGYRGRFADFVSTCMEPGALEPLKRQRGRNTDIRIEVPPGIPALYLRELSAMPQESELLLGRGLEFEVLEMGHKAGRWVGAIRILPPSATAA